MVILNFFRNCVLHKKLHLSKLQSFSSTLHKSFKMSYQTIQCGAPNTLDYKIYLKDEVGPVSPLHDIPLFANEEKKIYNMVVEIPRWTNAKMEINLTEPLNPIKQDVKNGKLRYVSNCFPHHGYIWNYGAFPQTWENPNSVDSHTGYNGDGDPIDVMEIGYRVAKRGEVLQVKVVGVLALIDEGETDWKLFAIDINDPLADQLNDISDVDKHFPGLLKATIEWYKIYKIPDGKPENKFAFNGEAKPADFARKIIDETHRHWKALINKEVENHKVNCINVKLTDNSSTVPVKQAEQIVSQNPPHGTDAAIPTIVDKWHFIPLKY